MINKKQLEKATNERLKYLSNLERNEEYFKNKIDSLNDKLLLINYDLKSINLFGYMLILWVVTLISFLILAFIFKWNTSYIAGASIGWLCCQIITTDVRRKARKVMEKEIDIKRGIRK